MTAAARTNASRAVLHDAAAVAGLSTQGAELISLAENDLWRLPSGVVARIARGGQEAAATREIAVTRWLAEHRVPAVRPLSIDQPVQVHGRATTFWEELPPHRHGTAADLAPLLRRLHDLPIPTDIPLGTMDPFVRVEARLTAAQAISISEGDRAWLLQRLSELREAWTMLPEGSPNCVIHGDAWSGNCVVTAGDAYLLDFERTSIGRPEWDLTSTAVAADTLGSLPADAYERYCEAYGYDVRAWSGYPTLRGIRELRMTTFAFQSSTETPSAHDQAVYRLACLRGERGPRPWMWRPLG